jgi:hypothetical protein
MSEARSPLQGAKAPSQTRAALTGALVMAIVLAVSCAAAWYFWRYVEWRPWKTVNRETTTTYRVDDVDLACSKYYLEHGRWPWAEAKSTEGLDIRDVITELRGSQKGSFNTTDFFALTGLQTPPKCRDAWGNLLMIRVCPTTGRPVIWSCGWNGRDETNDGWSADERLTEGRFFYRGKSGTGDDIGNW